MTARSWGLSENARIVREDVHIHSYVDITATTFPCVLHMCIVKLNCPFPFRWRWNDFFDWTYCKEDPRFYEINPKLKQRGLGFYGGLSSSAICPLSEALAANPTGLILGTFEWGVQNEAQVCRAVLDERTCEACDFFDGTDAVPPHDDCTSEDGCRCISSPEER